MLRRLTVTGLLLHLYIASTAQLQDSVRLTEVTVQSYPGSRTLLRVPSAVSLVDEQEIQKQSGQSFVPVMNTVPGVRMEERSPGSYRLSIRGSLLRSPFGIRNVKIYLEDFPLTDAGGNTYLNLLDLNTIHSIEVLKGPDGSLFGANSGGIVRINALSPDTSNVVKLGAGGGSYGLFQEYANVKQHIGKNEFQVGEGWQRSDGYRKNSEFDRKYIQLADHLHYLPKAQLTFFLFYSHLNYRTPGGLTLQEWTDHPEAARPKGFTPGAEEQKAGIFNSTFYAGVSHQVALNKTWSHHIALFGSHTDFKNPFITNFEKRQENTLGARTWLQASNNAEGNILLKFHAGLEMAQTNAAIRNYNNTGGIATTAVKFDNLSTDQLFVFSHFLVDVYNKWLLEGGVSLNFNNYSFTTLYPVETSLYHRRFAPQLMPRVGLSYNVASILALRASVSRGYSTPTLAEVRSSNNEINTTLQPENGWNYEAGFRLRTPNNFAWWDVSAFYYRLKDAIVRRTNEAGQEFFINAGGTNQTGMESQISLQLLSSRTSGFFRGINLNNALTISRFLFENYSVAANDYSGNKLTGVPSTTVVSGAYIRFPLRIYVFIQHQYTSAIFLDDANTVSTRPYDLVLVKAGCQLINRKKLILEISGGVDNLLNEKYSLGNDLNAIGGRYYNAAMPRNYFGKLEVSF